MYIYLYTYIHKSVNNYMKPYVPIYSIKYCVYIYIYVYVCVSLEASSHLKKWTVEQSTKTRCNQASSLWGGLNSHGIFRSVNEIQASGRVADGTTRRTPLWARNPMQKPTSKTTFQGRQGIPRPSRYVFPK